MIKKLIRKRLKKRGLHLVPSSNLTAQRILNIYGYFKTIGEGKPVDNNGSPIPWFTYPAIEFISQFDLSSFTIFEWGSGNSSLFFADRCKKIYSAEHDEAWFKTIEKNKSENHILHYYDNFVDYVQAIHRDTPNFDIIIIDGQKRLSCAYEALKKINEKGIIILDNSDWFTDICELFRSQGFNQIDFFGIGPINEYSWCTSFFFKEKLILQPKNRQPAVTLGGIDQLALNDIIN